ncbi:uncharacterized protein METZ01_LOCUS348963 [marine metagenome]|uniref:Uncharacterized protein n=1 Tax=marine metagenome TaxID=408172 RepID=A0A382REH0_9ZZZZ
MVRKPMTMGTFLLFNPIEGTSNIYANIEMQKGY